MNPNQKKYLEIARELINKYHVFPEKSGNEIEAITQALLTAIEEQKEKDAKIAENCKATYLVHCHGDIATAIPTPDLRG